MYSKITYKVFSELRVQYTESKGYTLNLKLSTLPPFSNDNICARLS